MRAGSRGCFIYTEARPPVDVGKLDILQQEVDPSGGHAGANHLLLGLTISIGLQLSKSQDVPATPLLSALPSFMFDFGSVLFPNAHLLLARLHSRLPSSIFQYLCGQLLELLEPIRNIDDLLILVETRIGACIAPPTIALGSGHQSAAADRDGDMSGTPTLYNKGIAAVGKDSLLGLLLRKCLAELTINFEGAVAILEAIPATILCIRRFDAISTLMYSDVTNYCNNFADAWGLQCEEPACENFSHSTQHWTADTITAQLQELSAWVKAGFPAVALQALESDAGTRSIICGVTCGVKPSVSTSTETHRCGLSPADFRDPLLLRLAANCLSAEQRQSILTTGRLETEVSLSKEPNWQSGRNPGALRSKYLTALESRNYTVAIDVLHAYFDYGYGTTIGGGSAFSGPDTPLGLVTSVYSPSLYSQWGRVRELLVSSVSAPAVGGTALGRSLLHYPLLHLGATELYFGNTSEAKNCFLESLRAAQINGDAAAVTLVSKLLATLEESNKFSDPSLAQLCNDQVQRNSSLYEQSSRNGMWRLQLESALALTCAQSIVAARRVRDWMSLDAHTSYRMGGFGVGTTCTTAVSATPGLLFTETMPPVPVRFNQVMKAVHAAATMSALACPTLAALASANRRWRAMQDPRRRGSIADATPDPFSAATIAGASVAPAGGSASLWSAPCPLSIPEVQTGFWSAHEARQACFQAMGYFHTARVCTNMCSDVAAAGIVSKAQLDALDVPLPVVSLPPTTTIPVRLLHSMRCAARLWGNTSDLDRAQAALRIWGFTVREFGASGYVDPFPSGIKPRLAQPFLFKENCSRVARTMLQVAHAALVVFIEYVRGGQRLESKFDVFAPEESFLSLLELVDGLGRVTPLELSMLRMLLVNLAFTYSVLRRGQDAQAPTSAGSENIFPGLLGLSSTREDSTAPYDKLLTIAFPLLKHAISDLRIGRDALKGDSGSQARCEAIGALQGEALFLAAEIKSFTSEYADSNAWLAQLQRLHESWVPHTLHAVRVEQEVLSSCQKIRNDNKHKYLWALPEPSTALPSSEFHLLKERFSAYQQSWCVRATLGVLSVEAVQNPRMGPELLAATVKHCRQRLVYIMALALAHDQDIFTYIS